ncbi:MAG TPA: ROK family protein [Bryobacteraceae bacterium]|nr:ROK family protein [Bryobacteraceae bacterium]
MAQYAIGVDLGGTNLRAAAIDSTGKTLEQISGRTELRLGRDAVLEDMVEAINALKEKRRRNTLAGIGIGVPGFIEIEKGFLVGSNNLPQFENFPVRDAIEQRLGTKVILENDANAAALGEKWIGAGRDVNDLVLLTLGTGIGGGIVAGGRIMHGFVGMAGELGHMTVYPDGNPCGCGNYGCLEKHASATAIVGMARMLGMGADVTSEGVYTLARQGNERANMIFRAVGTALGIALSNLVNAFNYPLYLLSGGVLGAWELFAPAMLGELERRSYTYRKTKTRIEKATLGKDAGLFGAAYLPFQA